MMNLEKISKQIKKPILNLFAILITGSFMTGCSKKCGECPSGQYLVVDNPKEKQCYCCPDGTRYDSGTGTCKY